MGTQYSLRGKFVRETLPLLKWDEGKKTVSVLVHLLTDPV